MPYSAPCVEVPLLQSTPPSSPSLASSSSSSSSSSSAATLAEVQQWTTDDVCAWLEREGLGRHAKAFRNEVVDGPTLLEIGDTELASCLGVPLGHRRRILRFTAAARLQNQPKPNQPQSHLQQPQPLHQQLHFQPQRRQQHPRQQSPHQQQRQRKREREREEQERERERRKREERERREEDARLARALQEEEDTLLAKQLELESSLEAGEVMDLTALEAVSAAADAAAAAPPVPAPIARLAPTRPAPPLPLWSLLTQRLAHATQDAEDHQMSYEDLVSLPNVAVGVRDIDRLPTMTFRAGMTCEPSCVICLSDFTTGDTLRRMECMHVFHKECVDKWLQQSKKCPSCNREMDL